MTAVDRSTSNAAGAPRALVLAAFAAIYVIWGSTYLAIKYAIETVPPFIMTGARFLIAGSVLYAWSTVTAVTARRRGLAAEPAQPPGVAGRRWRDAFIVGSLLIVGGTALVGWAELSVPSGITSLILATTPLWMVVMESALESKQMPAPRVIAGVVVGIAGLGVLVGPSLFSDSGDMSLLGVASLTLAALTWSAGAMFSRRAAVPPSPVRATAMQMVAGALVSGAVGVALGEHRQLSAAAISSASLIAVAYLVVAGALVGFTAYLWLMRVSTPSRVATHAYVNPVVAVLLGWAVLGEAITARTAGAMAIIVVAVVLIVGGPRRKPSALARRVLSFRHGELAERRS
jgi:drug/metabolite transporter (DMT)-like permease